MDERFLSSSMLSFFESKSTFSYDLSQILEYGTKVIYHPGDIIVSPGEPIDKLHYLDQGIVRLILDNRDVEVFCFKQNSKNTFGEPAFFLEAPSQVKIVAVEKCTIYLFPKGYVLSLVNQLDPFTKLVISNLCKEAYLVIRILQTISKSDCKAKLSDLLYILATQNKPVKQELQVTHEELADMLGASRVTVTRSLSKLEQDGCIETDRNLIRIKNIDSLYC